MNRLLLVWLLAALVIPTRGATAQSGVQEGSAAAAFGTGMAVARDADALFWNPALLGLQPYEDVRSAPGAGVRLMAVSVRAVASRGWMQSAAGAGLLGGGARTVPSWARLFSPTGSGGGSGASGDVVWISSATDGLGLAVSSHADARGMAEAAAPGDSVWRAAASMVSLGLAGSAGSVLGIRARAGVTLKARWVHVAGAGAWVDSSAGPVFFRETVLRGVPGGSVDVGMVVQPGPFVVSGGVSDLVRLTSRPRSGAHVRSVLRGPSGLEEVEGPSIDDSDSGADRDAADALYRSAVPPTVLRVGVSWSAAWGEPAVGVARRLREGAVGTVPVTVWSASFRLAQRSLPLRLGASAGGGSSGIELGWISGSCRRPWSLAAGRGRRDLGEPLAVSFSISYGVRSARTCGAAS